RYIVTVSGRGYRFAGLVKEWTEAPEPPAPELVTSAPEPAGPAYGSARQVDQPSRRWTLVWTSVALVVLSVVGYLAHSRRPAAESTSKEPLSLAILPFQSLTHDPESEFLGFSLVDDIITKLGYVKSLAVRPSYAVAKYRNQIADIPKVAADLHVNTLLTGS